MINSMNLFLLFVLYRTNSTDLDWGGVDTSRITRNNVFFTFTGWQKMSVFLYIFFCFYSFIFQRLRRKLTLNLNIYKFLRNIYISRKRENKYAYFATCPTIEWKLFRNVCVVIKQVARQISHFHDNNPVRIFRNSILYMTAERGYFEP